METEEWLCSAFNIPEFKTQEVRVYQNGKLILEGRADACGEPEGEGWYWHVYSDVFWKHRKGWVPLKEQVYLKKNR